MDKTYDELVAAAKAGKRIIAVHEGNALEIGEYTYKFELTYIEEFNDMIYGFGMADYESVDGTGYADNVCIMLYKEDGTVNEIKMYVGYTANPFQR